MILEIGKGHGTQLLPINESDREKLLKFIDSLIDRATLAERARCAEIAREMSRQADIAQESAETYQAMERVATAIESGENV